MSIMEEQNMKEFTETVIYEDTNVMYKGYNYATLGKLKGILTIVKKSYGIVLNWNECQGKETQLCSDENDDYLTVLSKVALCTKPGNLARNFEVILIDISSIKLNVNTLVLILKDGVSWSLEFQANHAEKFLTIMNELLPLKQCKEEKSLFVVKENINNRNASILRDSTYINQEGDLKGLVYNSYISTLTSFAKFFGALNSGLQLLKDPEMYIDDFFQDHTFVDSTSHEGYEMVTAVKLAESPEIFRGPLIDKEHWCSYFELNGRTQKWKELKTKIFRGGLEPALRKEAWKFLLGYWNPESTDLERKHHAEILKKDYIRMKSQWYSLTQDQESRFTAWRERRHLIEKDVTRTDRSEAFYEGDDNAHIQSLQNILMTYVMYNFDLGYAQGMSDLLSPILFVMEDEVDAFWCFVAVMERVGGNFELDLSKIKMQLCQLHMLLQIIDPQLCEYLEAQDSKNLYFCFRWLLILFKREFSFHDVQSLWEILWTGLPGPNFHLLICCALLHQERHVLMESQLGLSEILKHFNDMAYQLDLQKLLATAEALWYQVSKATNLPKSVHDILNPPKDLKLATDTINSQR